MDKTEVAPATDWDRPATGVTVEASARLHLGFLDLNGGLGRRFAVAFLVQP